MIHWWLLRCSNGDDVCEHIGLHRSLDATKQGQLLTQLHDHERKCTLTIRNIQA